MPRATGHYPKSAVAGQTVRAFVPAALPPAAPALRETSARQRNRVYAYQASLQTLTADEETTR
jgi:hypothetical protein